MANGGFLSKLLQLGRGRFGRGAPRVALSTVRLLSRAASRSQLHGTERSTVLTGKEDRFGGVTVDLSETGLAQDVSESEFSELLRESVVRWKAERKAAVWLHVPISLSRCAAAASCHGFTFHHAKHDHAVLSLWLGDGQSRLPGFATHQVGVAGAVVDESTGKVLVVQDRNKFGQYEFGTGVGRHSQAFRNTRLFTGNTLHKVGVGPLAAVRLRQTEPVQTSRRVTKNAWKFPGGLSDPGENIGATAVREVLEETGVRSEFRSLLSIRQQHKHPNAFGMSDMYFICRLSPLTYDIHFCTQECVRCEWLDLAELAETHSTTPITSRVARLLLGGLETGFGHIDLGMEELPAVYSGMVYQLYYRQLPPPLTS